MGLRCALKDEAAFARGWYGQNSLIYVLRCVGPGIPLRCQREHGWSSSISAAEAVIWAKPKKCRHRLVAMADRRATLQSPLDSNLDVGLWAAPVQSYSTENAPLVEMSRALPAMRTKAAA
jgi:hypothetical protein